MSRPKIIDVGEISIPAGIGINDGDEIVIENPKNSSGSRYVDEDGSLIKIKGIAKVVNGGNQ